MTVIRFPFPGDLDQHEAQFDDTDKSEDKEQSPRHQAGKRPMRLASRKYLPLSPAEYEAQFDDTDEGELVAGLAHLDSLAEPTGEPLQPIKTESLTRLEICMVLGVIGIVSLSILASLLS